MFWSRGKWKYEKYSRLKFFPHGLYFFIMLGNSKTEWMQQNENILNNFPCKSKHGPLSFI